MLSSINKKAISIICPSPGITENNILFQPDVKFFFLNSQSYDKKKIKICRGATINGLNKTGKKRNILSEVTNIYRRKDLVFIGNVGFTVALIEG